MQGNTRRDTTPEVALSSELHALGLRYRRDHSVAVAGLRVRPDFVFTRARVAIFVDGCFWHGCPEHGNTPNTNSDYWRPKLARNRERDQRVTAALKADGWRVLRVWEHEPVADAASRIAQLLIGARDHAQ